MRSTFTDEARHFSGRLAPWQDTQIQSPPTQPGQSPSSELGLPPTGGYLPTPSRLCGVLDGTTVSGPRENGDRTNNLPRSTAMWRSLP
jgi:hypothetical protein